MDFTNGRTPYDILELANGPEATEAEIRKAYKVLALKKHPDKNKNNLNAAAEFAELEKAYRVLTDASARGALDDYLSAQAHRAERQTKETDKRRRMREELEKREREVAVHRDEETTARVRLAQELERLRRKYEEQASAAATAAAAEAARASGGGEAGDVEEEKRRTLKVTWDPSTRDYTPQELRSIFSLHGPVVDVVVRERKAKPGDPSVSSRGAPRKASALVVMSTSGDADRAAHAVNGDVDDPLLVLPLMKVAPAPVSQGDGPSSTPTRTTPTSPSTRTSPPPPGAATGGRSNGTGLPPAPTAPLFPAASSRPSFPVSQAPPSTTPLFPTSTAASTFPVPSASAGGPGSGVSSFPGFPSATAAQGPGIAAPGGQGTGVTSGFGSFPGAMGGPPGFRTPRVSGAEDAVLQKMKREAERRRQLATALAEDGGPS